MNFFGGVFKLKEVPGVDHHGHLDAYDPLTGKKHWSYRSPYPFLASQLATAGDLVFSGDAEGLFFALDAMTGRKLWSFQTGSGHSGGPISYAVDGTQYIATPSGFGSHAALQLGNAFPELYRARSGATIYAFALPNALRGRE